MLAYIANHGTETLIDNLQGELRTGLARFASLLRQHGAIGLSLVNSPEVPAHVVFPLGVR